MRLVGDSKFVSFAQMNNKGDMPAQKGAIVRHKSADFSLNEMQQNALTAYLDLLRLKDYSPNTIKVYKNWFTIFLLNFPLHKPSTITKEEIIEFMLRFRDDEGWSSTTQNQLINAIKFFYENVLNRPATTYDLPRAKKPEQLPTVFSESEVLAILNATDNLKHKAILSTAYASGLRVSELVNLKINDIDSKRMVINVRQAKGKKDRMVMLSEKLLELLREYYKKYLPKEWMFEGQKGQYTSRSITKLMDTCKKKAKIKKKGSVHALRHSFATHLLESGTDLLVLKELLGHNSIRTTVGYTHVSKKMISKIQSPFDKL